uniref:Uncharacterized protein n=1 Tax=Tanacetum cinerariifolium TaxID=118510 RepID=A0A6L2L7W2_TANCI|nr:hypothetical protein [Tanacetum cinerariifolium]
MEIMIEQQVVLDEALVPSTKRLRIGRSNFRLPSDIQSKEPTLQVVYDVLRGCPFFKAFLVTADVLEIYIQELWATAYVHQHSIRLKMDSKKNIVDLEAFRDMLDISPRKKPSIPRRNKVNWHNVRDDMLFSTIKVVSRHQNTQQYGLILPIKLTTEDIRNTKAYKEYYACATREAAPKPKASARRKRSDSDTSITPPTATPTPITNVVAVLRLLLLLKENNQLEQKVHMTPQSTDEGTGSKPGVQDIPSDDSEEEISWNSSNDEDVNAQDKDINDDEGDQNDESDDGKEDDDDDQDDTERDDDDDDNDNKEEIAKIDEPEDTESGEGDVEETKSDEESAKEETREKEEESFDPISRTSKDSEDDDKGKEDQGLRGRGLQVSQDIEDSHVTLTLVYPDGQQESSSVSSFVTSMLNPISDAGVESIFTTASSSVAPLPTPIPTMTPSIIISITTASHPLIPPTPIPSVSNILGIVHQYMNQQMHEAVRVAVQIQTDRLYDSYQRENDEFLKTIDDNMKRIIKEQVKSQVKDQVLRILPRIKQSVNAQLESEVLTRSSHSSRTSYAVATDLTEMELKKILIDKMEGNKSIQRSDEQQNLYKALVDTYEADKTILETYGDTAILKRRCEDDDDQEGPFARSDRGSKRRREGREPESASTPSEPATRSASRSTTGTQSRQMLASESAFAKEPVQTTCQMDEPSHSPRKPPTPDRDWNKTLPAVQGSAQTWISKLVKQADSRSSFNKLLDTSIDFSNFIMNQLCVDTLTPELMAGPTYELMMGSCTSLTELEYHLEEVYKATTDQLDWVNLEGQQYPHNLLQPLPLIPNNRGRRVISFAHFINNDLEYLWGGVSSRKHTTFMTKTKAVDYGHIKWIEDLVPRTMCVNRESALDVYSKRRIIAVTDLKIVEWHNYKHLDWISIRRDDDKIYKFKEGDFKRLRLQYIKDMMLLLIQGKLSNLTVKEHFAFNVSLRMFTRSIVIQRRVEDLQLGVKSYQKRLNLTKPDTYRSDLKRREAYTAYSNPRGFVYQNKDKKNRLMRIDELYKFSDGMLNDVCNALDDRLKGIRMQYLPQTIWRKGDKDKAAAMIQAIDKMLKTRRIMRSLERFVGGRLYEGDFRMLQRTI